MKTEQKPNTVFSLLEKAKLSNDELKVLQDSFTDIEKYYDDSIKRAAISLKHTDLIRSEMEFQKTITPEFECQYKDALCLHEEVKQTATARLLVLRKFHNLMKEVTA